MRYSNYRNQPDIILLIIITCVVVFFGVNFAPQIGPYLALQPATALSHPWTILTSLFVHANLWHLFANMLTLYFFGNALLQMVSQRSWLIIFFGGGLAGSLLFILLNVGSYGYVIGASGAVFALGGALAVLRPNSKVMVFPLPIPIPLWIAVLGSFAILSFLPSVAWQGHLGGLLVGLACGYLIQRGKFRF
ncbi:protease [Dehalococcoides mccartyi CG4]|uniref:rhomboid family intramembrane serine protease n=1 Tax=Dehalococcoides mccartyi TaxID=61435 RepID=UPI0004E07A95|nr:rhomboid family intramembrane serine protease [Dehalococcoides mccartyi]AII58905.1 protease [Dehalococcoides mccartyi CG4]